MADRRTALLALGIGAIGTATLFYALHRSPDDSEPEAASSSAAKMDYAPNPLAKVPLLHVDGGLPRPSVAAVELGVLTEHPLDELKALVEPGKLGDLINDEHCGEACDAVRAFVADGEHARVEIVPRSSWKIPQGDALVAASPTLSPDARKSIELRQNIVVVHTSGVAYPDQLPVRAAFALTASIADRLDGFVYDQLIDRIESAPLFDTRTFTEPLGTSVFRNDRIDVQRMARKNGKMRVLTVGLARFGAPDVEVPDVAPEIGTRLPGLLVQLASAIVDGASTSPISVQGLRNRMDVELAPAHVEEGDPNIALVRVLPWSPKESKEKERRAQEERHGDPAKGEDAKPAEKEAKGPKDGGGEKPERDTEVTGYERLAQEFGPITPSTDQVRISRARAQRELPKLLERAKQPGNTLYVQMQFEMPGDGTEWMWVAVKSADETNIVGTLVDAPVNVPSMKRGDEVKRPRSDVMDYLLKLADGKYEGTVGMTR